MESEIQYHGCLHILFLFRDFFVVKKKVLWKFFLVYLPYCYYYFIRCRFIFIVGCTKMHFILQKTQCGYKLLFVWYGGLYQIGYINVIKKCWSYTIHNILYCRPIYLKATSLNYKWDVKAFSNSNYYAIVGIHDILYS